MTVGRGGIRNDAEILRYAQNDKAKGTGLLLGL